MTLTEALNEAIEACKSDTFEECGGILLNKGEDYKFVKIRNKNTGQPLARSLWSADEYEYGKLITPLLFKEKYVQIASFHTHPRFSPDPSQIDLTQVFTAFPVNYIYSNSEECLVKYTWLPDGDTLKAEVIEL